MQNDPVAVKLELSEGDRQIILLALAKLSLERPGWLWTLNRLALMMDNASNGGPVATAILFEQFRKIHGPAEDHHHPAWEIALVESVRLQSHYADLLNMHDGGNRMTFESASDWMQRLVKCGTIPEDRA